MTIIKVDFSRMIAQEMAFKHGHSAGWKDGFKRGARIGMLFGLTCGFGLAFGLLVLIANVMAVHR